MSEKMRHQKNAVAVTGNVPDAAGMKLRLREIRERKGLSLEQVAQAAGTTRQSVSRWERDGFTGLEKLERAAAALGVSVVELIDDDAGGAELDALFASLPPEAQASLLEAVRALARAHGKG